MQVVLDTNVLAAAARSRNGASYVLLQWVQWRKITPVATVALFLEYEAVLKRANQMSVHRRTLEEIDLMLADLARLSVSVDVHFRWRPQLADADDELVLEAAVNGHADALITHNVRDFHPAGRFGIRVMTPGSFLETMRDER